MKLYDILLPREGICAETKLFYHVADGSAVLDGNHLAIEAGTTVCFDTFFNSFSGKYQKYTKISTFGFALDLQGCFDVEIEVISYSGRKTIASKRLDGGGTIEADIGELAAVGFAALKLSAVSDGVFLGGYCQSEVSDCREIKIGIVICTFKREKYVLTNLKRICAYAQTEPTVKNKLHIFVIDNAGTLDKSIENDMVTLTHQPNLGGSGGFSRGMYEVYAHSDCTHMLLMDDDVVFYPETLQKTMAFLQSTKNEYRDACMGAGMMRADIPYHQHEFGAFWAGIRVYSYNGCFDLRKPSVILANETIIDPGYSGWWYMCMPAYFVQRYGLSLPFFIKYDDVEYSLRACKNIVMLNGVGVWHEAFNLKNAAELEYYNKRNELILTSVYSPEQSVWRQFRKLVRTTALQLVCMRYKWADMAFKAYDDYLKGADYLNKIDMPALHQELRANNSPSFTKAELQKQLGLDDLEYTPIEDKPSTLLLRFSLNGYLIPRFLYPYCKYNDSGVRIVDATKLKQRGFFCANKVLIYNWYTESGYFVELKKRMMFKYGFKLVAMLFKLMFGYRKAAKTYADNLQKLSSIDNWKQKMNIT